MTSISPINIAAYSPVQNVNKLDAPAARATEQLANESSTGAITHECSSGGCGDKSFKPDPGKTLDILV